MSGHFPLLGEASQDFLDYRARCRASSPLPRPSAQTGRRVFDVLIVPGICGCVVRSLASAPFAATAPLSGAGGDPRRQRPSPHHWAVLGAAVFAGQGFCGVGSHFGKPNPVGTAPLRRADPGTSLAHAHVARDPMEGTRA